MSVPSLDEYWGQGGTYLQDPKTGKRTLVERTEPAVTASDAEVLTDGPALPQAPDPGKNGKSVRQ